MEITTAFSTEEIKQQTDRILNFPTFLSSPILRRFLEFIIDETLNNRDLHLKEYSIAIQVLNRSRGFNPAVDSVVRIHAGRLRRALTEYYLTSGMYDPIIIQIPKGRYIPEFTSSGLKESITEYGKASLKNSNKPMVAVFPLKTTIYKNDLHAFPALLEGLLSEELLKFPDIAVKGYYSSYIEAKINKNVLEAGLSSGADYIITGSLTYIGQQVYVLISLLVTATGEVLVCKSFNRNILPAAQFEMKDDITQSFIDFANGCYRSIIQHR